MNKKRKMMITNYVMLISLIIVMTTGFGAKLAPSMWMGISHAVSGIVLTVSIAIHCFQHRPKR